MKDSRKIKALRKILEQEGKEPSEIETTLDLLRANEENASLDSLRSWIAVIISGIALLVSIFVAIYK